jgi:hypothetical protein
MGVHLLPDARSGYNGSLKACVLDELEIAYGISISWTDTFASRANDDVRHRAAACGRCSL